MKIKFLNSLAGLLCATLLITSCLDSDYEEIEYSAESSITAFSIGDILTEYKVTLADGTDTTLTKTVTGSQYPFAIDQNRKLIYNVDSLPVGTDISKVVAEISFDGYALVIAGETAEKDSVWESTDSLDFNNPIKFKAMALNGTYGHVYTAWINVHKQEPDSLSWSHIGSSFPATIRGQKAVAVGERIFVFARQNDHIVLTSTGIDDGKSWVLPRATNLPKEADHTSVTAWGNEFLMPAGADLYRSSNAADWSKVETDARFGRLIANVHSAYNNKVYAISADNRFMESMDGTAWEVKDDVPATFPQSPTVYAVSPLVTNTRIERLTVMGNNTLANDTAAVAWSRLTTEGAWAEFPVEEAATDYCPAMENLGLIYYNGRHYAFGGPGREFDAFSGFYTSADQCITWQPVKQWMAFPEAFAGLYEQAGGSYSYVVDKNNFLWFIWSGSGEVWKGRINKMGFEDR